MRSVAAFVFPGQGSQFVGMGRALAERWPRARELFEQADAVLGTPLSRLCWEGPDDVLTDTINAQPAILVASIAAWRLLCDTAPQARPEFVAGHSLGEFSALVAADALDFADALRLVRERGRLMKAAGQANPGGMAAVLGAEREVVAEACAQASTSAGEVVQIANDNCPGQIVISGARAALDRAAALAKARGARVRPLAVSIAAHSPLMRQAAASFRDALAATPFRAPRVPVIANVTAAPLADEAAIRDELVAQLTSSVLWTDSVRAMIARGAALFVELGPKDVLTGLLKRIDGSARAIAAGEPAGIEAAAQALAG